MVQRNVPQRRRRIPWRGSAALVVGLGVAGAAGPGRAQPVAPGLAAPDQAGDQASDQAAAHAAGLGARALTFGLLGGGLGVAIASGLVYGLGQADEDVVRDAARDERGVVVGLTQVEAVRLQDSASRLKTVGAVGLGLAGGLLVGGLVSWLLEPAAPAPCGPAAAPEPAVRPFGFAPLLAPGQAGLSLGLSF